MSKKEKKNKKEVIKNSSPTEDFIKGCEHMKGLFTSALIEIFGKKTETKASKYLLEKTYKVKPSKVKLRKKLI